MYLLIRWSFNQYRRKEFWNRTEFILIFRLGGFSFYYTVLRNDRKTLSKLFVLVSVKKVQFSRIRFRSILHNRVLFSQ